MNEKDPRKQKTQGGFRGTGGGEVKVLQLLATKSTHTDSESTIERKPNTSCQKGSLKALERA